jgi:hypothetical protein
MVMDGQNRFTYRSLFWPVLLIGIGLIWFLHNIGVLSISWINFAMLLRMWPILLVVLGIDLLFGRRSPWVGGLLGLGAALFVLALVLVGPSMGLVNAANVDLKRERFTTPIADTTTATVELGLPVGAINVHALSDSSALIDAEVVHVGDMEFSVSGEREKTVRLTERARDFSFDLFGWMDATQDLESDIGLSPFVPLDLDVQLNVGDADLDLSQLQLTGLNVRGNVGQVSLSLPAAEGRYTANLEGDVGAFQVEFAEPTDVDLTITGNVGGFVIDVPDGAGVRLEGRVEVGGISLPDDFVRLQGGGPDFVGQRGVWQSRNYNDADHKIDINFQGDVGGLKVR